MHFSYMFTTIKAKALAMGTTATALLGAAVVSAHAGQLEGMTASSTPMEFVTAAIVDVKGYLLPILGVVFGFTLIILAIRYGFRKIKSVGGRG